MTRQDRRDGQRARIAARRRRERWIAAFAVVAIVTAIVGYLKIMTAYLPGDDEGYMLTTLREFLERGGLYENVYSQYGPFYSEFWAAIFGGLGLPIDRNYARGIVLVGWLATSGLIGASIWRLTRNGLLAALAQLLTFIVLGSLVNEPLHPGGLICLLLAAIVAVAVFTMPRHPTRGFAIVGVLLAALCLVKVNVGGLATLAALVAAALTLPGLANRRAVRCGAAALTVVTPLALMAGTLDQVWTQRFALIVVAAVGSILVTAWPDRPAPDRDAGPSGGRLLAVGTATMAATALVICLIAIATGTTVSGLVDGVVITPLGQADAFTLPFNTSTALQDYTLLGFAAAVFVRRTGVLDDRTRPVVAVLGGALMLWALTDPSLSGLIAPENTGLTVALPLAWVAVLGAARPGASPTRRFLVVFIAMLAVLQALHAYPVAGSQTNWATFLLVAVGALALGSLRAPQPARLAVAGQVAVLLTAVLFAKVTLQPVVGQYIDASTAYRANPSLGIQGADRLHLDRDTETALRGLTAAIKANCRSFMTLPGLLGLYAETGQRPPTGLNATSWMYLFDDDTQQRVVDSLVRRRGLCIVRNDEVLDIWRQGRPVPDRPLYRYLSTDTEPIGLFGKYALLRKRP